HQPLFTRWRKEDEEAVNKAMRATGISDLAQQSVDTLSGGQRQTVAIARSLLLNPKIIMLDEPTAALGVAQTAEVLNRIERVRERGLGVIIISHNMEDVRAVTDRIV
ncbi:ATP-binding cassette domain-containing protein, partial [Mycobacterium tuberculosis]|nr:ATP-binding cassette domain-containing protein [Mycobacterium tuberculosis]